MTVVTATAPPGAAEGLAAGLRAAAAARDFAAGRIRVSKPLQLFTLDAADLWDADPLSRAAASGWRFFVLDGPAVFLADIKDGALVDLASGPTAGAALQTCRAIESSAAAGTLRVLSCPLIGRECFWVDGSQESFWMVAAEDSSRTVSRSQLIQSWSARAAKLGIAKRANPLEEKGDENAP